MRRRAERRMAREEAGRKPTEGGRENGKGRVVAGVRRRKGERERREKGMLLREERSASLPSQRPSTTPFRRTGSSSCTNSTIKSRRASLNPIWSGGRRANAAIFFVTEGRQGRVLETYSR